MFALLRKLTRRSTRPASRTAIRPSWRPMVDGLEDRSVPAAGLGAAANFAVLGINDGTVNLARATLGGDVGLGPHVVSNFNHAATTGQLLADPTAIVDPTGLNAAGGAHAQDLSTANDDALSASANYAGMTSTLSITNLRQTTTLTGNGGTNVINVGQVNFRRGDTLNLNGTADDVFVFNVAGSFNFQGGVVNLGTNVTASHVLFNFPTTGSTINISGTRTNLSGTFLAPSRSVDDTRTGTFIGAIVARDVTVRAGDTLVFAGFNPPGVVVGQPATLSGSVTTTFDPIPSGVEITLDGLDTQNNVVHIVKYTVDGIYTFDNVPAGTYTLTQTPLDGFDTVATAGTVGGVSRGMASGNTVSNIVLNDADVATGFDFANNAQV